MEGAVAGDDLVAVRIAGVVVVLAHQLDAALHGFRAGVGEEHRVGEGRLDQPLCQALALGNPEEVGGVPESSPLFLQRGHEMGMAVTQAGHGDAAGKVQVALALAGEEVRALAPLKSKVEPRVGRHDGRNHLA